MLAVISTHLCHECGKEKQMSRGQVVCSDCTDTKNNREKKKHLRARAKLPTKDRLARLEAEMYDAAHAPHVHVPAPRF